LNAENPKNCLQINRPSKPPQTGDATTKRWRQTDKEGLSREELAGAVLGREGL
jgi:hypothetical protein